VSGPAAPAGTSGLPIALDAMGGDDAPAVTVAGARAAQEAGVRVVLVGDRERIAAQPDAHGLRVVHAAESIGMGEDAALAVRQRRGASVRVAAGLVARGEAAGLVSAGSTGATLAAALLEVGRVRGVRRPVIGALLPLGKRGIVLADAGAGMDVQPEALRESACMARAYARALGVRRPTIGLLNVGAEPGKGNELTRAAAELLASVEGFTGNVEPAAALRGAVDVVVTDGFTGNVFLKTIEALAPTPNATPDSAAVLLGVAAVVLVAHGAADAAQIAGALRMAQEVASAGLCERIAVELSAGPSAGRAGMGGEAAWA